MVRKGEVNIFITDEFIGIYQQSINKKVASKNVVIELEKQIVENGYIVDPEALFLKLKTSFKQNNIKPKSINMIIHDQNLLIREFIINKEDLQRKSIPNFIDGQKGKSIHFPFDEANITYFTKSEDEQTITAVVVITDQKLLHDYHDVFDRLGIRFCSFNITSRVLYRLYNSEKNLDFDQTMFVTLFNNMITINVLEKGIPVFGMIEEFDGTANQYYTMVENYIERVANYYKYNIKKGAVELSDIVLFNFTTQLTDQHLKEKIKPEIEKVNLTIYESEIESNLIGDESGFGILAYAGSIVKESNQKQIFNFTLDRVNKLNRVANYLMVVSFAIFSGVALIYIPFLTFKDDINNQINVNNILEHQLEVLIEDTPDTEPVDVVQSQYSDAYEFLIDKAINPSVYFTNLLSKLNGSLAVERYTLNSVDQEITVRVSATSEAELSEYLIIIYESYGVTTEADDLRWMVSRPVGYVISSLLMEVTITYA